MPINPKAEYQMPAGLRYQDNRISMPAFSLLELSDTDLSQHEKMGVIRLRIGNFRLRKPGRSVRRFKWESQHDGENPSSVGQGMPDPSDIKGRKTRWDVDPSELFNPQLAKAQRVLIRVVLDDDLIFWDENVLPAITAKDAQSQQALANLVVDAAPDGRPRASFWALRPANPTIDVEHGFNIAVVAVDETNPKFSLPVIIDPSVKNRG